MQREDCRGRFQKKIFNEAEEIASLDMGARNQYSFINFLGEFIDSVSQVFVANERDFYTVVFGCGESLSNTQGYLLFLLDRCTMCEMQIAVARVTQLCRPNVPTIG